MPFRKTKEDTWKEEELLDAIQGSDRKQKSSSKASKSGESSRHRSKEEGKDRDRAKHRRSDAEDHKKENERKERDRRKEKSEDKYKDPDDGDKSRRRHREEDRVRRKEEGESSSRRKEDKVRTESKDERARRKEREKEEKHREHRKDKESRKDRERSDDKRKDTEKRRKHKSENGERSRNSEKDNIKEKQSESKGERRKHRSSKREEDDPDEVLTHDARERNKEDSSKSKEKGKDYKEKRSADEVGREERPRASKDTKVDKKRSHEKDGTELLRKRDSFQHPEEEIEEEMTTKRRSVSIRKTSILNTEEVNEEEIDANEYDYGDDDFEDYDDDFEQDDGEDDQSVGESQSALTYEKIGVDEIQKAIREENELAGSINNSRSSSRPSTRDEQGGRSTISSKSQPRGKINFIAAKQKKISEKVASKTRRRGQELSKLIELDVVGMDIFELQPFNIYEVYMKSFGRMNTEQVAVQTNDDTLDQEVQTDEIKTETRWSQFSNEVQSFGGGDEKTSNTSNEEKSILRQDTRRLNKFLSRAAQLCITLLSESESKDRVLNKYVASHTKFSDSIHKLVMTSELIHNRRIIDNDLSQSNLILLAYGKLEKDQKEYVSPDGVICIWNLNAASQPQKYLSCGSAPKCCCFSPRKPSYAFAGMEDGSVSAWDLREPDSMHTRHKFGETEAVIRRETFSTASVYSGETHSSSVVSICAVASPADSSDSSSSAADNNANGALQIISLEENGTVNIWVVIEVFSPDPGGSPQDLGLIPGGKIKLVKSGAIFLQIPKRHISMEKIEFFSATTLHVDLNHAKSLYVGTDQGVVLHSSRFGDKVNPKYFGMSENDAAKIVSSIDHSPWDLPYILVGCTDGSVYLFNSHQGYPVTRWLMFSRGAAITRVQWSRSKPGVFFTLDKQSCFYVWDLFASESGPLMMDQIKTNTSSAVDFCLTNDSSDGSQRLVIFYDDNAIEVHRLNKLFLESSNETLNQVCSRLEEIS